MVTSRLLRDFLDALHSPAAMHRADPIDEYRELAMLARVWERSALEARLPAAALSRAEEAERKAPALR